LTDQIASQAMAYIQKIDDLGGALAAIECGFMQNEIQEAAYNYQKAIEKEEQIVVGVNKLQVQENLELERLMVDPAIEQAQKKRLFELRSKRDANRVAELLSHLEHTARDPENMIPVIIECVENWITLGEICNVLRQVWGEYQSPAWV
jgi:methylmalonyl-CoA mutase, N-terminal domain